MLKKQTGYTFIEVIVVIGIVALFFGYIIGNLIGTQNKLSVNADVDTLIADLKSQQSKAMLGTKENNAPDSFGIYFEQNRYILFHGTAYSPSDISNFPIKLNEKIEFSGVTFPGSMIIFSQGSGEIQGFVDNLNSITIKSSNDDQQKTIKLNKYGVVTEVN